ncbi:MULTISPECIES: LysR family transcriptional regulator [Clostridium]|uniref:LysR family transcriptional regulator n=1 Tax=Clostridium TaxID=1485 RepID=UPI0008263992|nr:MULTISPECIES: LysR family transcriptional regulator [Clostridium]PJI06866.1 LysR family transcriptional regulator [Clostridium sp. CT7]
MDLLQLKYFKTVAKFENVTKAANELYIAQPALSKTISHLEKELGVRLFDRRGKYIHLNKYGRTFLEKVNIALAALEDGRREIKDLQGKEFGDIRLVFLAASTIIPELISEFCKLHPHISFQLFQHFLRDANNSDFDLCISSSYEDKEKNNSMALLTEEIYLAVPLNHSLAKKKSISLTEVSNENFISLKQGKELRKITDGFCKKAHFSPKVIFESDDPATVRGLIKAGQGVAFIPQVSWGGSVGSSMAFLHIKEPECKRTIFISWDKKRYLSKASLLFRKFAVDYFKKLHDDVK